MKKLLIALGFILTTTASFAATQISNVVVKGSIIEVQAMKSAASQYPDIQTTSYLSGLNKGGAFYHWNASSTTNDCAHIAVTGVGTGRYILRSDLQNGYILPTQCGAYFDSDPTANTGHDDTAAWNATEVAAQNNGYIIGPVSGVTKILDTVTPGVGVIHQGAGQGVEIMNCRFSAHNHCFYLQNANGTNQVQAPKFYDMTINGAGAIGTGNGTTGIQYNSIAGGFDDTAGTQAYMINPVVQNVTFNTFGSGASGAYGIQCSKCFEGKFNSNAFDTLDYSVDLEGSDFMDVKNNQITNYAVRALEAIQHGTFGNFDVFEHNDINVGRLTTYDAPIYSTARSIKIDYNGLEDNQGGQTYTCEIHLADGQNADIINNVLGIVSASNSICVDFGSGTWYNLDIHANNVATGSTPNPRFSGGLPIWINSGAKTNLYHYNNRTEVNFPMNTVPEAATLGGKTVLYATPNTETNVSYTNYGVTVRSNTDAQNIPSFVIPALGDPGSRIDFISTYDLRSAPNFDLCIVGSTDNPATNSIKIVFKDAGVPTITTFATLGFNKAGMTCPAALQNFSSTGVATFSLYNDGTGNDYIESLIVMYH